MFSIQRIFFYIFFAPYLQSGPSFSNSQLQKYKCTLKSHKYTQAIMVFCMAQISFGFTIFFRIWPLLAHISYRNMRFINCSPSPLRNLSRLFGNMRAAPRQLKRFSMYSVSSVLAGSCLLQDYRENTNIKSFVLISVRIRPIFFFCLGVIFTSGCNRASEQQTSKSDN